MRYNNYHKHTYYSNIMTPDCVVSPEDYAKRAVELGHTTLCTTEHGYFGNIFEYYEVAKKYGLKLIFGIEYYYVNDRFEKDRSNSHLMILAKNENGRRQMTRIMSESAKTGYYGKPRIDKELLFSLNPNDVIVTSTCVISYINKFDDYEENFVKPIMEYFGENFYLEIHDNTHPMQVEYNKRILDLHHKYKIPFIHATDSHYIYPEQDIERTAFLEGKNIFYPEEDGFILDYPTSDQIFERYEQQGVFSREQVESALNNTLILDDFEDVKLDKNTIKMPILAKYSGMTHEEKCAILKQIIVDEFKKELPHIDKSKLQQYKDGIKFEYQIIEDTQMEDYFLINYEIIKLGKQYGGVLTKTGRGSAPSYYLNKLLGFTEIDRFESPVTLYPTRFISTSRILETKSLPDIDYNTASTEPFVRASKEILGENNVYVMTAYGTLKESGAFRNLCRAKKLPMSEYNEVAKNLDSYKDDPKWKTLIEESKKYLGVIDSVSPHPCAYLLYDHNIDEEIGIIRVGDELCVLIDSTTSDSWKYLKNDYLTVTVWDIIDKTSKAIGIETPSIRELDKLIESDEKVWDLYNKGLTATLNQTGTDSAKPQVVQYKPKSVRELSGFVAAIRPSFESMKKYYLERLPFSYGIEEFDALLKESDNFILYQENIMSVLIYAGFPEDETYGLLKAIAKKKEGIIEPIQQRFIDGFIAKTGSEENALKVWKIIEDAVGYGFNSSHSLSVAYDSLYGAWQKANYPLEYFTTVLNIYSDDIDMTDRLKDEMQHFGITLSSIKYGQSRSEYSFDRETKTIYKGVASIKYLNGHVAEELYQLSKEREFDTFTDLLRHIHIHTSCSFKHIEILTMLNFFDQFGGNKKLLKVIELYQSKLKNKNLKDKTVDVRMEELRQLESELESKNIDIKEQIKAEIEYFGYEVTVKPELKQNVYIVTEIDTKYTPRLRLYNLRTGEIMKVKVYKKTMQENPFGEFSVLFLKSVTERESQKKVNNEWVKTGNMELILKEYQVLK